MAASAPRTSRYHGTESVHVVDTRLALSLRDEPHIRSRTVSTWRVVSGMQRSAEHISTLSAAPMDDRRLTGLTDNVRVATSASGTNVRCSGGRVLERMFGSHA